MTTTRVQHPEPEKRESGERSGIARVRPAPERPCTTPEALLRLQCAAGNAAVASVVGARPGRPSPGNGPSSSPPVVARQPQEEDGGGSWLTAALAMREKLSGVLGRAGDVVGDIVAHPVRFLTNLVTGVRGGIFKFQANIVDHLRRGLVGWLFGALAEGGVEVPTTLDGKGVVSLLSSVFGLTWSHIRSRVTRQIGETAMTAVERGVQIFQTLATEGVAGLWQMLLSKLGDVKEMLLGQVREFVTSKVITAGVTWLISALNPAAALVKALKLIYDGIMFFVDNGSRLAAFVNTVLDSLSDVARGSVGVVVDKVEGVLGRTVPILIDAFARILGLGGIGRQIRSIVETVQKPVDKALDVIIAGGLKLAGPIIRGIKGINDRGEAKVAAGQAYVKGKIEAGKKWTKDKTSANTPEESPAGRDARSAAAKQAAVDGAICDAESLMDAPHSTPDSVAVGLPAIKSRYRLTILRVVRDRRGGYRVHAELNPRGDTKRKAETAVWEIAPGGFTAHEGQQFVGPDGTPMVNARGRPIMVHTIVRHVTIPPAGVAARVARGLDVATGFVSAAAMEEAVMACLDNRRTEINERLERDGNPAPPGTSLTVTYRGNKLIGYGYSVIFRPSQVGKQDRGYYRTTAEVKQSDLTGVTVHLRVTDVERRRYMVETAYPTPKG